MTHMRNGDKDYRFRLTLTLVPGRERRYKEIYCLVCSHKILETYDELAYVSDVDDLSNLIPQRPSMVAVACKGTCHVHYEIKTLPGLFDIEVTRLFFLDTVKKHREVHCALCKELFCTVTLGEVFGLKNPYKHLTSDENGFVPTLCPKCEREYEITTNLV